MWSPIFLSFPTSNHASHPPYERKTGRRFLLGRKKSKCHFTHIHVASAILWSQLLKETRPPGCTVSSG